MKKKVDKPKILIRFNTIIYFLIWLITLIDVRKDDDFLFNVFIITLLLLIWFRLRVEIW